jgi:hypothetical protein
MEKQKNKSKNWGDAYNNLSAKAKISLVSLIVTVAMIVILLSTSIDMGEDEKSSISADTIFLANEISRAIYASALIFLIFLGFIANAIVEK